MFTPQPLSNLHRAPSLMGPLLLLVLLWAVSGNSHATTNELPDMGDNATTSLTPEQEARIGMQMMRNLRRAQRIVDDPLLTDYIQRLGNQLSTHSTSERQGFTFFIVNHGAINAFAMPGGYIGVNSGLILASESENELASVLAHEISHVTQHHLARGYDKASKMNLPMTAAVIAAIILGAHNPQIGQAALATAMAGSQQMQLDFTRANEHEADRVGIQLLAQAGFDPSGMANFFEKMQKETRYYGNGMPEFLSSHPVTTTRIAEAQERSTRYPQTLHADSDNYHAVKAILRVRASRDLNSLIEHSRNNLRKLRTQARDEEQFTLALALLAQGSHSEAISQMQALLNRNPGRIAYLLALADMQRTTGQLTETLALYRKGLDLYPDNPLLTLAYGKALVDSGESPTAAPLLQNLTRNHPQLAEGFQSLAEAESAQGHQAASHVAYAEYYVLRGELPAAIEQLTLAQRNQSDDFYLTTRIEARLKQLKALAQQQRHDEME